MTFAYQWFLDTATVKESRLISILHFRVVADPHLIFKTFLLNYGFCIWWNESSQAPDSLWFTTLLGLVTFYKISAFSDLVRIVLSQTVCVTRRLYKHISHLPVITTDHPLFSSSRFPSVHSHSFPQLVNMSLLCHFQLANCQAPKQGGERDPWGMSLTSVGACIWFLTVTHNGSSPFMFQAGCRHTKRTKVGHLTEP